MAFSAFFPPNVTYNFRPLNFPSLLAISIPSLSVVRLDPLSNYARLPKLLWRNSFIVFSLNVSILESFSDLGDTPPFLLLFTIVSNSFTERDTREISCTISTSPTCSYECIHCSLGCSVFSPFLIVNAVQ